MNGTVRWNSARNEVVLVAIACVVSACAEINVRSLNRRPVNLDSAGVTFVLRPAFTAQNYRSVCLILDSLRYAFHPPAQRFQPLTLTDTTIHPRVGNRADGPPIALRATFESNSGARVDVPLRGSGGRESPSSGTLVSDMADGAYGFGDEGVEVCLGTPNLLPGVSYDRFTIRSTSPIVIKNVMQHTWTVKQ